MRTLMVKNLLYEIEVSRLILGTAEFGVSVTRENSFRFMDYFFEQGGNTFDTANVYGRWGKEEEPTSEKLIGLWMKEHNNRKDIKIITKGAHYDLKSPNIPRVNAKSIMEDVEDSLKNLRTDYLDIYLLHRDDKNTEVGELMEKLHDLVSDGTIKIIGVSNWTVDRIIEANEYARLHGLTPLSVSSIEWSLAEVTPEHDEFAELPHMNSIDKKEYYNMKMPVLAWSALANGVITKVINEGENSLKERIKNKFYNNATKNKIELVRKVMQETGLTPTQITLGYITNNSLPGAAILGCSRLEQLIDAVTAADVLLERNYIAALDSNASLQ
jgi:aryl-alcohol dehydrogenase-like predicted oxidoreductase